jgi:hypothetical protein
VPVPVAAVTVPLLSECPLPSCLAAFPEDYYGLRLHLAHDHFSSELKAALLQHFERKSKTEEQLVNSSCLFCGRPPGPGRQQLIHYYLSHGFLDSRLQNLFACAWVENKCPSVSCKFSNISQSRMKFVRKALLINFFFDVRA